MFLPSISSFVLACGLALSAIVTSEPGARGPGTRTPIEATVAPAPQQRLPRVTVVAGSGPVAPADVERARALVADELPGLVALFDGKPQHAFFVHVHAGRDTLPPALAELLHAESPAFALLGQHQIHLVWDEMRRLGSEPRAVVRHELVHELLDQYAAPHGLRIPRWFHEGLAQHIAGDTYLRAREDDIVWRLIAERLPTFDSLRQHFPRDVERLRTAYAMSYSYVAWLAREHGVDDLLAAVRATDELTPFEGALAGRLRRRMADVNEAWRHYVLHGSGAPWRFALESCFSLCLIAALPLLVLAMRRRLLREGRAQRTLTANELRAEHAAHLAAEARAAAARATVLGPPPAGADDLAPPPEEESGAATRRADRVDPFPPDRDELADRDEPADRAGRGDRDEPDSPAGGEPRDGDAHGGGDPHGGGAHRRRDGHGAE